MSSLWTRIASRLGYMPQAAAARAAERAADQAAIAAARRVSVAADQQQRSLIAALTTPDVHSWQTDGLHINASTAAGLAVVRARSRDAAWNNGYARRFLGMVRSNVLGPSGVRYQARLRSSDGKAMRKDENDRLEAARKAWCRRGVCDVTGRYTWRAIERLALRAVAADGESFLRFFPGKGPHGFQVQLLPADAVPLQHNVDLGNGVKVRQGIEVDATGRVLAYHLRTDDTTADSVGTVFSTAGMRLVRVPADDVLHLMLPEEVGQLRGVPWMATALKRMYQAADFASSGLNKARESAKRGGWITEDPNGPAPPDPKVLTDGDSGDGTPPYATLHDGTWEKLPAGLKPEAFANEYPNIEYGAFIADCVHDMAGALDVAYFTLGNDLEAVNYSGGQLGLEGERTMWRGLQQWFIEEFVDVVDRQRLRYALLAVPVLATLKYDRLQEYADAAGWQPHVWQPLDAEKTIKAQRSRIDARLTSPQRVIAESGEDPDEIVAELLEWEFKTKDLPPMPLASGGTTPKNDDDTAPAKAARMRLIASRAVE